MATPNIVPRADSEGGLGTASKYWASAYIDTITTTSHIVMPDNAILKIGTGADLQIYHDGSHNYIDAITTDQDIIFKGTDGGSDITALTLDMSDGGRMLSTSGLNITGGNTGQVVLTSGNAAWDATIDFDTTGTNEHWRVGVEGSDGTFYVGNIDQGGGAAISIHPTTKDVSVVSLNGIPFYSDVANNSMYTHDVSGTDSTAQGNTAG